MQDLPEFRDTGKRILQAWKEGLDGLRSKRMYSLGELPADAAWEGISEPPRLANPRTVLGKSPLLGKRDK